VQINLADISGIHPYLSLRASTDILGTTKEALENTKQVLEDLINSHQGNPVVVGPWNSDVSKTKIGPLAQFDTRLFWSLSSLQQWVALPCLWDSEHCTESTPMGSKFLSF
jgi:hypothetical protein